MFDLIVRLPNQARSKKYNVVCLLLFSAADLPGESSVIELSDKSGSISSPHYPYDYPDSQNVTWRITPINGYRIVAQMEFLNTSKCAPPSQSR